VSESAATDTAPALEVDGFEMLNSGPSGCFSASAQGAAHMNATNTNIDSRALTSPLRERP
jgi:hypothetical protein